MVHVLLLTGADSVKTELAIFASKVYTLLAEYSRTSVARTQMARLPQLFHTHYWVPNKNYSITAVIIIVFEIISGDFLLNIDKVCCVFIRIASI